MSPGPVTGELRAVLAAPRGSRFSRPGVSARLMATPPSGSEPSASGLSEAQFRAREQRLLAQMADNPRVAHRQKHGVLPHWVYEHVARIDQREREHRTRPAFDHPEHPERSEGPWKPTPAPVPQHRPRPQVPRPRPAPDDGPPPPRPPRPPLPRRPRRPRSHRKPRHRRSHAGRHLFGYTLAALAGALAHHLAPLLS